MLMATYLYCVRSDPSPPPRGLLGIDGSPVRDLAADGLTAWVSEVGDSTPPTVERVKAHDAVCAAALETGDTPLPIRFGQVFRNDAAAVAAITSRRSALST